MAFGMVVGHLAGDLWQVGGRHHRTPWSPCTWLMSTTACCHINMEIPCHSQISGHPGAHYHQLLAIVSMDTTTDSWLSLRVSCGFFDVSGQDAWSNRSGQAPYLSHVTPFDKTPCSWETQLQPRPQNELTKVTLGTWENIWLPIHKTQGKQNFLK